MSVTRRRVYTISRNSHLLGSIRVQLKFPRHATTRVFQVSEGYIQATQSTMMAMNAIKTLGSMMTKRGKLDG
jgi:hypothetical protein